MNGDGVRRGLVMAAAVAGAVAAGHVVPAGSWLPGPRGLLLPGLDGRGHPGRVALTFDDGPDPRSTPHILRALDRLQVRATFFVLGDRLAGRRALGRLMAAEGHELAVHGWHHDRPWWPRPVRDAVETRRTAELVAGVCGEWPLWYRPPYGILTGGRWTAARTCGLRPVLWSAWGRDWAAGATPDGVTAEVLRGLRGGGTVLLHDSDTVSAPDSWRATLGALPGLVGACRERGLTVGRLADHAVRGADRGHGSRREPPAGAR